MKKLLLSLVALCGFTCAFAGTGTEADPYTVAEVIAKGADATENGVFVKGFVVGSCTGKAYDSATFTATGASNTNVLLADAKDCTDASKCIPVQLPSGNVRTALSLSQHAENLGREVILGGDIAKYFSQPGLKNTKSYKWVGDAPVDPDPVDPVDPNKLTLLDKSVTAAETAIKGWTIDENVWSWKSYNNSAYLNGSGYNKTLEADAYAISPVIDLTAAKSVKVAWDQAAKFQTSIKEACGFVVREAGATTWTSVAIPTWPELDNKWTWTNSGEIDLSAYAGKKIQVAFKYGKTCTDTWEIRDMVFTADAAIKVVEPEVKTVDYANIAAFLTAANTTDQSRITGATTAVYQNGRYLWLKDNSGVVLAYNGGDIEMPKFANGQTVEGGITGKYQNYSNGQLQMSNLVAGTFKAGAQGAEVEAELLQVEEVATDLVNTYVRFEGVTVAEGTAANNYVMSDASGEIALFNQFNNAQYYDVVEVATGTNLTVYGFVAIHSGNLQIMPVKVTSASGKEVVAAPTFSVPAGAVAEGTEVTISCATEGATIYYTTDGTNPTAASTVYSTPVVINEALTLKALAVKDGMDDSAIATAEYTIKANVPVTGNEAMFNFAEPETLYPAQSKPESGKAVEIPDVVFSNNGISLVGTGGGTTVRLWLCGSPNHTIEYRVYNGGNITISAQTGYNIKSVKFEGQQLNTLQYKGTASTDNNTYEWTATEATNSVTFDVVTNGNNKRADINKVTVVFEKTTEGIADIELGEEAPAEYYNLQGVRMEGELTPGLYIRRQGNKATKVIVK